MADIHGIPGPPVTAPDTSPAAAGARRDADLAGTLADLAHQPSRHVEAMQQLSIAAPEGGYGGEQGL